MENKKNKTMTYKEIAEVVQIFEDAWVNAPKKYSMPTPYNDGQYVYGYGFTIEEYEKIRDYVNLTIEKKYKWDSFDEEMRIDGGSRIEWYIAGNIAILTYSYQIDDVMYALKALEHFEKMEEEKMKRYEDGLKEEVLNI